MAFPFTRCTIDEGGSVVGGGGDVEAKLVAITDVGDGDGDDDDDDVEPPTTKTPPFAVVACISGRGRGSGSGRGRGVVAAGDDIACVFVVVIVVFEPFATTVVVDFFVDLSKCSQNAEKLLKSIGFITSIAAMLNATIYVYYIYACM